MFPQFADVDIEYFWGGLVGCTQDRYSRAGSARRRDPRSGLFRTWPGRHRHGSDRHEPARRSGSVRRPAAHRQVVDPASRGRLLPSEGSASLMLLRPPMGKKQVYSRVMCNVAEFRGLDCGSAQETEREIRRNRRRVKCQLGRHFQKVLLPECCYSTTLPGQRRQRLETFTTIAVAAAIRGRGGRA